VANVFHEFAAVQVCERRKFCNWILESILYLFSTFHWVQQQNMEGYGFCLIWSCIYSRWTEQSMAVLFTSIIPRLWCVYQKCSPEW